MWWKTWKCAAPCGPPISSVGADDAQQALHLSALSECVCVCVYWIQPSYDFIKLPKERKCGLGSDFPFARLQSAADLYKQTVHSCPLPHYVSWHFIIQNSDNLKVKIPLAVASRHNFVHLRKTVPPPALLIPNTLTSLPVHHLLCAFKTFIMFIPLNICNISSNHWNTPHISIPVKCALYASEGESMNYSN